MAIQLIQPQLGPGETHDPTERFDWSGISALAQKAREASEIARERRTLRELMGQEARPPEPGFMGGMKRVFGMAPEQQPISDLERMIAKAKIGQEYPTAADRLSMLYMQQLGEGFGASRPTAVPEKPIEEPQEGYEWKLKQEKTTKDGVPSYSSRWAQEKLSEKDQFSLDLRKARRGDLAWSTLREKYPLRDEEVKEWQERSKRITKPKIKQVGAHRLIAKTKPGYAGMNATTRAIAEKIETYGDLRKLVERSKKLKDAGVNVESLLQYYSKEIKELEF